MSVIVKEYQSQKEHQFDIIYKYFSSWIPETKDIITFKKAYDLLMSNKENLKNTIDVAFVVVKEVGMGLESLLSSLLHDINEKPYISKNFLTENFGSKVVEIIQGIQNITCRSRSSNLENINDLSYIYLNFIEDIRIIIVKVAIQVIEMRMLKNKSNSEKSKKSLETKYIYLPIIQRLGLTEIKSELEDLCFKYLYPNIYNSIVKKIKIDNSERKQLLDKFIEPIKKKLEEKNLKFSIFQRVKSITSIWHKVQRRGIPFDEIYDSIALRIVLDEKNIIKEKKTCWDVYEVIADLYKVKTERTRDWLTTPKNNGYESLHMTVIGNEGYWGEIQIRSSRMNDLAENGPAAHWRYKKSGIIPNIPNIDKWINDIKLIIERKEMAMVEILHQEKLKLYENHICIITEKGNILKVPRDSTILDISFLLKKSEAISCIGGKVNNKVVPLNHVLKNGDRINLYLGNSLQASDKWFSILNTQLAKSELKKALNK